MRNTCSVEGCDRPCVGRGWCDPHYRRWKAYGHPGTEPLRMFGEPSKRFVAIGYRLTESGCHEWPQSRNPKGYGHFWAGKERGLQAAHRYAWEMANGTPIPPGMEVRHRCDNPPCINPEHLEIGTHTQNIHDSLARSRNTYGDRHPKARLTADQVTQIRRLRAEAALSFAQLARDFNVAPSTIVQVVKRKTWRHVT